MASTITQKKPMLIESVGALYYAFNKMTETGEYNSAEYDATIKSNVVKKIGTTDNSESTTIRASGEDYEVVNQVSSIENSVEVVAIDPEDLAKMKGEDVDASGLVLGGAPAKRPFFAFGKVVKKVGEGLQFVWYPKCQLVENTEEASTSEETYSEQNTTITIKAFSFDDKGHKKVYVDSETKNFPAGLTEQNFFESVIVNKEGLAAAAAKKV